MSDRSTWALSSAPHRDLWQERPSLPSVGLIMWPPLVLGAGPAAAGSGATLGLPWSLCSLLPVHFTTSGRVGRTDGGDWEEIPGIPALLRLCCLPGGCGFLLCSPGWGCVSPRLTEHSFLSPSRGWRTEHSTGSELTVGPAAQTGEAHVPGPEGDSSHCCWQGRKLAGGSSS